MANLIILFSNCFACRHFLMQVRQKQWLQFGSIPKRCSRGGFSITTSKQTPHVLSLERATAKDNSISCSCCLMHSCNSKSNISQVLHVKSGMQNQIQPRLNTLSHRTGMTHICKTSILKVKLFPMQILPAIYTQRWDITTHNNIKYEVKLHTTTYLYRHICDVVLQLLTLTCFFRCSLSCGCKQAWPQRSHVSPWMYTHWLPYLHSPASWKGQSFFFLLGDDKCACGNEITLPAIGFSTSA